MIQQCQPLLSAFHISCNWFCANEQDYVSTLGMVIGIGFCLFLTVSKLSIVDCLDMLSICCPCSGAAGEAS